jgi:hypothetical protein
VPPPRATASTVCLVAPMPWSPTTGHDDLLERTAEEREPFRDLEEVGCRQAGQHLCHTGRCSFARLSMMPSTSWGERQDDTAAFLGMRRTVDQLASHQTVDHGRCGRAGDPQVLGHAGEGSTGRATQKGKHAKLGNGQ